MILADLLRTARQHLTQAGIDNAPLDARLIVEHFAGVNQTDLITRPDRIVSSEAVEAVRQAITRRAAAEPVHRILGFREFYGLKLKLSADTLEPRPDTETLIDAVLPFVQETVARLGRCDILDLGTGSGAIALALLSAEPLAQATATDISEGALDTAWKNAVSLGLDERFKPVRSNWFGSISGEFHAIVSNPPYIPKGELAALQQEVRDFDPPRALDGGADGLDAYRVIAGGAKAYLRPDGIVAVEVGKGQAEDVAALFREAGLGTTYKVKDLASVERVVVAQR